MIPNQEGSRCGPIYPPLMRWVERPRGKAPTGGLIIPRPTNTHINDGWSIPFIETSKRAVGGCLSVCKFHFFTHPQTPGWHQGNRPYWGPTCTRFQRPKATKTPISINCNILSKPTNTHINPFHKPAKRIYVCLRGRRRSWRCFGGRQRPEEEEVNSKSLEDAIALGHGERSRNWTKFLWKEKAWEISKLIASTCFNVFTCQNSPRGRLQAAIQRVPASCSNTRPSKMEIAPWSIWNNLSTWHPQDISKISLRYPPDICKTSPRYPQISPRYPQISPWYLIWSGQYWRVLNSIEHINVAGQDWLNWISELLE